MVHLLGSVKYGTTHDNLDGLFYGILLGQEYGTVMGSKIIVFKC